MLNTKALQRAALVYEENCSSYERRPKRWYNVTNDDWQSASWQMQNRLRSPDDFEGVFELSASEKSAIQRAATSFSVGLTPHFAALIRPELAENCPIRLQSIAKSQEFEARAESELLDPLGEEAHSILACVTQRYPDRALIYTNSDCAVRCRHCTRKRKVGIAPSPSLEQINAAIHYIGEQPQIRDVLISGGDPLVWPNSVIAAWLERLRAFAHIDVIRLCTRMPSSMPQRIDEELCRILENYAPIYVQTQFNHYLELCAESEAALHALRRSGAVLSNQSVLLRKVNDSAEALEKLNRRLLRSGCKPYYLFNLDRAFGTSHFRVDLKSAMQIMDALRGRVSGLAIPQFVVDLPGGYGKVPLCPQNIVEGKFGERLKFRNWYGEILEYNDF
ncbi:MAG: KamA family radical SAM protein [Bradymonadales bacterium]|jgi:lysine 2,3-aminomutase